MAAFTASPVPGAVSPAELIEQLGAEIGQLYAEAELAVLKLTADAVRKGLDTTDLAERASILRQLQAAAAGVAQGLVPSRLAREVLAEAAQAGDQAAIERLGLAPQIPVSTTRLSVTAANAIATLGVQLVGGLSALTPAILRSSADVYQRTIATVTAQSVAGGMTRYEAQRQATAILAREGSPAVAYGNGARMPVGSYAEMATRTASNRAWQEGHIGRMSSSGVNLVQIVIGVGSCEKCARWAGKVLSTDGRTGQVEAQHATDDGTVTVTVAATLDQARAAGWNHPNCRCTVAGYFPGIPSTGRRTTYDPKTEKARSDLRALERRKREYLRREAIAATPLERAAARRSVRDTDAKIRDHVKSTGVIRQRQRESLIFTGEKAPRTPVAPVRVGP